MFRHKMPMHSSANDGVGSLPEIKFNFVMLFQHLRDEVTPQPRWGVSQV